MFRYIRAANVNSPPVELSDKVDCEFWRKYENKISSCHSDDTKCQQLVYNLSDTLDRLFDVSVKEEKSESTHWIYDNMICFTPSKINIDKITSEQQASLKVMHNKDSWSNISVVIDLSELTWSLGFRITKQATYHNIIDGLRLWSTIPHSIKRIHIIKPRDSNFNWIYGVVISQFLSDKLKKRISLHTFIEELAAENDS